MKKLFLFLSFVVAFLIQGTAAAKEKVLRPKLVVGLIVDQMRWDYLYRYFDRYGETGFKRVLNEGFSCENTMINYVPTITSVGHASVYTGSVPAIHGITGNSFVLAATGQKLNCVGDESVRPLGTENPSCRRSPRNLLVTTMTDELRLATNFRGKSIGIALKDRAAILPAGHAANAAYWFDSKIGCWVSSSYYMDKLPDWVEGYNRTDPAACLLAEGWNTLYPIETYTASTVDKKAYEVPIAKEVGSSFPYDTAEMMKKQGKGVISNTPFANVMTMQMAKLAVKNEELGKDDDTDFLAVSFSSPDVLGHLMGVNAVEMEDMYLRLDKELGDFFTFLDEEIGKGNYTLFLTADHAGPHHVDFLREHKLPGKEWDEKRTKNMLDSLILARFHISEVVKSIANYQVFLNCDKIPAHSELFTQVKACVVSFLQECEEIAYAVDCERVSSVTMPQTIRERIVNGYNPQRSGDVQIILKPGWYSGAFGRTNHGVWCAYDSHIPLLFMGWGVAKGRTCREVHVTDIAATVAALLKIQMPSGCVGVPVTEVIK